MSSKPISGGYSASEYGLYVWGVDQTHGSQGNLIQPLNNPSLYGKPIIPTPTVNGGNKKQKKIRGGFDSLSDPALNPVNASQLANNIANSQMDAMTKPNIPSFVVSQSPPQQGGRRSNSIKKSKKIVKKKCSRKKIYTKNKKYNGKRRTSKIR